MPRNPSTGVYSKPAGTTPSVGQVIDPVPWNALTTDIGNEITNSLPRDGSTVLASDDDAVRRFTAADRNSSVIEGGQVMYGVVLRFKRIR
ncbi:hypothetical protein B5P46_08680 [Rhizobium leguminosarum]|uniref:Uncharacterized protein n=1 Tax=Rhizobium leguminosarum TaxID=384 RepID=A0A4Q1UA78_RHILE|nr:hypothetical protein [Rhizobium leguminosarum]RXT28819.1 hypothetical protein B5P46_08680 [Rhizobium leguminosarum]